MTGIHIDTEKHHTRGKFHTVCSCGESFTADNRGSADSAQLEHRKAAQIAARPINWDDLGSSAKDLWEDRYTYSEERYRERLHRH